MTVSLSRLKVRNRRRRQMLAALSAAADVVLAACGSSDTRHLRADLGLSGRPASAWAEGGAVNLTAAGLAVAIHLSALRQVGNRGDRNANSRNEATDRT